MTPARRATRGAAIVGTSLAVAGAATTLWNVHSLRRPMRAPRVVAERVSVLVPARDEGTRIAACLSALADQRGLADFEILVLDDGSTDDTAAQVRAVIAATQKATPALTPAVTPAPTPASMPAESTPAESTGRQRIRLVPGGNSPPPPGWLGKSWACHRLAGMALGRVLVFVDADVVLEPDAIASTVALLREDKLDLVSPYPAQIAETGLERLVQPLLQWSWLSTQGLRSSEEMGRTSTVVANGQLLAVDARAYRNAGGHETSPLDVLDDMALARTVRRSGGRTAIADGSAIATCRMYDTSNALVEGYTKSLWSAFGSASGSAAVVGALALAYVVPPILAVASRDSRTRRIGRIGYVAAVIGRGASAQATRGRMLPDALAHPLSIVVFSGLVAESWRRRRFGLLTWKGRPLTG